VECTGEILSKEFEGESLWVKVKAPNEVMRFIVPKGFIAVDGASLTVCDVNQAESWFTFMLVSYTQAKVNSTKAWKLIKRWTPMERNSPSKPKRKSNLALPCKCATHR